MASTWFRPSLSSPSVQPRGASSPAVAQSQTAAATPAAAPAESSPRQSIPSRAPSARNMICKSCAVTGLRRQIRPSTGSPTLNDPATLSSPLGGEALIRHSAQCARTRRWHFRGIRMQRPIKLGLTVGGIALVAAGTTVGFTSRAAASGPPTTTPIKHLVVIFQENISFDHYFGTYPIAANPAGEPAFHAASNTPTVNNLLSAGLLTNNPNTSNPQR